MPRGRRGVVLVAVAGHMDGSVLSHVDTNTCHSNADIDRSLAGNMHTLSDDVAVADKMLVEVDWCIVLNFARILRVLGLVCGRYGVLRIRRLSQVGEIHPAAGKARSLADVDDDLAFEGRIGFDLSAAESVVAMRQLDHLREKYRVVILREQPLQLGEMREPAGYIRLLRRQQDHIRIRLDRRIAGGDLFCTANMGLCRCCLVVQRRGADQERAGIAPRYALPGDDDQIVGFDHSLVARAALDIHIAAQLQAGLRL